MDDDYRELLLGCGNNREKKLWVVFVLMRPEV